MGCRMNDACVAQLKDALDFAFECRGEKPDAGAPVAIRTRDGVDEVFYVDLEDGRIVLTPESFYREEKKA